MSVKIIQFRPYHIDDMMQLNIEFEQYLTSLSTYARPEYNPNTEREQILKNAFWKWKNYSGYIAKIDDEIIWFALYHYGFDPDEFRWKIIYLISLFVSEKARGHWVGRALIEKLQSHEDSLGLYFWVWKKNIPAIEFYKKMWADWEDDVPFMKLLK